MSELQATVAQLAYCPDSECGAVAEAEQDGDLTYFTCSVCGYEFGYQRVNLSIEPSCQLGIPEDVRRKGSPQLLPAPTKVPVTLGRRREG
jgi:hypothetical protein